MRLHHCHNFHDFRLLAKRQLPGPIFDYVDGGAEGEAEKARIPCNTLLLAYTNVKAFEQRRAAGRLS